MSKDDKPDFAFPQNVIEAARRQLDNPQATEAEKIRAAIKLTIAENDISTSHLPQTVALLDSLAQKSSPQAACILYSLQAQLLNNVYKDDSGKYNNRKLPLTNPPADPREWSKDLFAQKICELVEKSLQPAAELQKEPLQEWAAILSPLKSPEVSYENYPTLYSLLARRGLNLLSEYANQGDVIPFTKPKDAVLSPSERCTTLYHNILTQWYAATEKSGNVAELAHLLPQKIKDKSYSYKYDTYLEMYDKYKVSPYAGFFLCRAAEGLFESVDETKDVSHLIDLIHEALSAHPDFPGNADLNNALHRLNPIEVAVSAPSLLTTDQPLTVKVSPVGLEKADYIGLYQYASAKEEYGMPDYQRIFKYGKFLKALPIPTDTATLDFGKLPVGDYALFPVSDKSGKKGIFMSALIKDEHYHMLKIHVSDLTVFTVNDEIDKVKNGVFVVDARNGEPVPHCKVKLINTGKRPSPKTTMTNSKGFVSLPFGPNEYEHLIIEVSRGTDTVKTGIWYPNSNREELKPRAQIFTDLSLYHPGDTCQFALVTYRKDVMPLRDVKVILQNASYQEVDSLVLSTDRYGRANGQFVIPKGGMNGRFTLKVHNKERNYLGETDIRVEEYKLPTFYVEMEKPKRTITTGQPLVLTGVAKTYSGMPVSGANVKLNISFQPFPWWFRLFCSSRSRNKATYNTDVVTDAQGRFSLTLPTENLKGTRFANGRFTARAVATSTAAESQESEAINFVLADKLEINFEGNKEIEADRPEISLKLTVEGEAADKSVKYSLSAEENTDFKPITGEVRLDDETSTAAIKISTADLPSGRYSLRALCSGAELTDTITVWRREDKVVPCPAILWAPKTSFVAEKGAETIPVRFGSSRPDAKIFYGIKTPDGNFTFDFVQTDGKMYSLNVPTPTERGTQTRVYLIAVYNGEVEKKDLIISPYVDTQKVEVERIAMRDHITAGGREHWTFRYRMGEEKPLADLPVIGTLTDAALNSIYPFAWGWNRPSVTQPGVYFMIYQSSKYCQSTSWNFDKYSYLYTMDIVAPDIYLFQKSLYPYSSHHIVYCMRAPKASASPDDILSDEDAMANINKILEENTTSEEKKGISNDMSEMLAKAKARSAAEMTTKSNVKFRPAEMPLAWFRPCMTTDAEGYLNIEFTAPDFNTTWQLQLLGYTPDMLAGIEVAEITASKPVMVTTASPRFLRTGDVARLNATLFNATDEELPLSGRMEIYDPLTGRVVVEKDFPALPTAGKGSRVIGLDFTVPDDVTFVGYRVSATALDEQGRFTDGEQSLISIQPSSSPVTESYPFYLAPTQNEYSMTLPKTKQPATLTLQYTDNPIWECVTALPDMSFDKNASIFSRVNTLYGNAIAAGLTAQYPQIAEAIELWKKEGGEELVSKLQQNPELKIAAIENTPWMQNAQSETLRMGRLANLLDTTRCREQIDESVDYIVAHKQRNGGLAWVDGCEPSMFVTAQTLWRLGMLRQMGYLPKAEALQTMIPDALRYCDNVLVKDFKRHKRFSVSEMLNYLYIRSFFPEVEMDKEFLRLKGLAMSEIKKEWREFDIYNVATAATLLKREKEEKLATTLLESLRQRASSSPERGLWYDNLRAGSLFTRHNTLITTAQVLEAFQEIEPENPAIDGLRQWLIIERQAQDWGQNEQLAEVIYAILTSGSDWTIGSTPAKIFVNGVAVEPGKRQQLTGSFTMQIDAPSGSELRVIKHGEHQAWGGLIARYIAPITEVKEFSQSDVTVTKRILVVEETDAGTSVKELTGALKPGQKVRVQLKVTSARDIDYAVLNDERSGCLMPVRQLSGYTYQDGVFYYREVKNDRTLLFLPRLPKGDFLLEYDCHVTADGLYTAGIATLQSLYAPSLSAHSAGLQLTVATTRE